MWKQTHSRMSDGYSLCASLCSFSANEPQALGNVMPNPVPLAFLDSELLVLPYSLQGGSQIVDTKWRSGDFLILLPPRKFTLRLSL